MNSMQLSCFLTVAETLNFAKAAQHLNVTQPAVTQQIHSLEEELNVTLFLRTTRKVELTRAGLMFIPDAKSILDIMERAKKRMEGSFEDQRKPFVIGCHTYNDVYLLTSVLEQMRLKYPEIYPVFQVIPFRHIYQHLVEGSLDAVIAFQEYGLKEYIYYKELTKLPVIAVSKRKQDTAAPEEITISALEQERLVVLDPRKCPGELAKIQHQVMGNRPSSHIYLCDSIETSVTLARAGYGTAIVPDHFAIRDPALSYVPIADTERLSYGIYYKKLAGHPELKSFLEFARTFFSEKQILI
ncbi:LysR family transcriptional regulator [Anaerotignum lactatifermentans]|uniref:LysR family transcriptional regulator n=1 Tax=Anaerotignum lactatifermentans TaxID=160404 RepID=A0ABS2G8S4_9FIRM|nr:LysR family transcriptional regulator [Anaerotignum lactatifermentans]MBM6828825.1 LysR family transcriptional regulator [Anaerotignum lactatifermentans]MBM6877002.1 LysR family transcriptional regulator [Anaerotignum lactatifermentans]MBM6950560.1 LysR family transcriptional regulator [Anaerotignum lactatifermentans]